MIRLFISDLHLSKERPAITRAFFRFMAEEAAGADELYILGDLFEAWIGDDDPETLARAVVAGLRKLSDGGTKLYFLHGNRDFLVGRRFARETGCTLLPDYHLISNGDQKILLCHGDTLCTEDKKYQRFRRKVRNPFYRWLLAHLPLRRRLKIAADWRARSLAANSNKPANIMDVTPAEVERQLAGRGARVLIHGHTHRPGVHRHGAGDRVVLGDWEKLGWFVRIEGETLDLIDFPIGVDPPKSGGDGGEKPAAEGGGTPSLREGISPAPTPPPQPPPTAAGDWLSSPRAQPREQSSATPTPPPPSPAKPSRRQGSDEGDGGSQLSFDL